MLSFAHAKMNRSASLMATLLVGVGCTASEAQEDAPSLPLTVEVLEVELRPEFERTRWLTGVVRSRRASRLGFERGGRVRSIQVEEGDKVKKGARLALLDTRELVAARRRLQAALTQARAQSGLSALTAKRLGELAEKSFTPTQRADEARFGSEAAAARVEELEASIAEIDLDIRKSALVAPFSGVVTDRLVDEGTVVGAGTPVLRLQGEERKEAFVGVPVTDLDAVAAGTEHIVEVGGRTGSGRVVGLVDDVEQRTRTVGVVLELSSETSATDGQIARLALKRTDRAEGFWLPMTALTAGLRGTWTAYLVQDEDAGEVVRSAALEILHVDSERVYARGTVRNGDRLVASGLHRVVPGQVVASVLQEAGE